MKAIFFGSLFACVSLANLSASQGTYMAADYSPPPQTQVVPGGSVYGNPNGAYPNSGYAPNPGYNTGNYQGSYQGSPYQGNYQGYQGSYSPPPPQYNYYNQTPSYGQPYGVYNGAYSPGILAPPTSGQVNPGAAEADRLYNSYKYLPQ